VRRKHKEISDVALFCENCQAPSTDRRMGYNGLWLGVECGCFAQDRSDFENGEGEYADEEEQAAPGEGGEGE
jgi:hypothetical protein